MYEIIKPTFDVKVKEYKLLGRGPRSIKGAIGWNTSDNIYYRCAKCGTFMLSSSKEDFRCECGAMSLDTGYGRFGSRYGDDNILVYKKI